MNYAVIYTEIKFLRIKYFWYILVLLLSNFNKKLVNYLLYYDLKMLSYEILGGKYSLRKIVTKPLMLQTIKILKTSSLVKW